MDEVDYTFRSLNWLAPLRILLALVATCLLGWSFLDWYSTPANPLLEQEIVLKTDAEKDFKFWIIAKSDLEVRHLVIVVPKLADGKSLTRAEIDRHINARIDGLHGGFGPISIGGLWGLQIGPNSLPQEKEAYHSYYNDPADEFNFRGVNLGTDLYSQLRAEPGKQIVIEGSISPALPHPLRVAITRDLSNHQQFAIFPTKVDPPKPSWVGTIVATILGIFLIVVAASLGFVVRRLRRITSREGAVGPAKAH